MKSICPLLVVFVFYQAQAQFKYVNPVPGSSLQNRETNIILKNGDVISKASVTNHIASITGSSSGNHPYKARLSDDHRTVILIPETFFEYGETVVVNVRSKLKTTSGDVIHGFTFSFGIRNEITPEEKNRYAHAKKEIEDEESGHNQQDHGPEGFDPPDSMPTFQINHNLNPSGRIFFCNESSLLNSDTNCFPTIMENDGTIVWAQDMGNGGADFKINHNGYLTYFKKTTPAWIMMDSSYHAVDSFQCGNGYAGETNGHDFQIFPDHHALLLAFNYQTVDMTAYGGLPDASVVQIVLQELDANHDVVFEWRSFDHFQFTDAIPQVALTNTTVDYCHTNAIEKDFDGNILISSRNFSEITKIDHSTGVIIWRLGGENNQFTFTNDITSEHFSKQHDVRRLLNGHITLFNNGTYDSIPISSAKEYALDEANKVATLAWYYEHPDTGTNHVYGKAKGNVQRLPNGNTMICWGTIVTDEGLPNMTEVDSTGQIVWELTFDEAGQESYRAYHFDWNPCLPQTFYADADNDGYGNIFSSATSCNAPAGYVADSTDCNDSSPAIYPGASEVCNGIDDNCNGATDEGLTFIFYYADVDSDGFGNPFVSISDCIQPSDYVIDSSDCDDTNPNVNPAATEVPNNNVDDDCDGYIDEFGTGVSSFVINESFVSVYPNPFSSSTTISFSCEKNSRVTIAIYDLTGRKIKTVLDENLEAGNHEVQLNREQLSSGIYFLRTRIDDHESTIIIVLD